MLNLQGLYPDFQQQSLLVFKSLESPRGELFRACILLPSR